MFFLLPVSAACSLVLRLCPPALSPDARCCIVWQYKWDVFEVGLLFTYLGVCGVAGAFFGGCLIGIVQVGSVVCVFLLGGGLSKLRKDGGCNGMNAPAPVPVRSFNSS